MRKAILVIFFVLLIYGLITYYNTTIFCPIQKIKYKFKSDISKDEDPFKHPILKMSKMPDNMFLRTPILW